MARIFLSALVKRIGIPTVRGTLALVAFCGIGGSLIFAGVALTVVFLAVVDTQTLSVLHSWFLIAAASIFAVFIFLSILRISNWITSRKSAAILAKLSGSLSVLITPATGLSVAEHLRSKQFRDTIGDIPSTLVSVARIVTKAVLVFAVLTSAGAILVTLVSFVGLIVGSLQVFRLKDQNTLLKTQNELLISNRQSEAAEAKLTEVRNILLDAGSPIGSQVYALKQLPSAMTMEVASGEKKDYPNLAPLKAVFSEFIRLDRVGYRLREKGLNWEPSDSLPSKVFEQLLHLEPVSTEILKVLHQLGPKENGISVWNFTPDGLRTIPEVRKLEKGYLTIKQPLIAYNGKQLTLDLSYLPSDFFNRAQLPCAMRGNESIILKFAPGMQFNRCHFEGWFSVHILAENAEFRSTRLDHSRISFARLRGSSFMLCSMDGSAVNGDFTNCSFHEVAMNGTWWESADLQACVFLNCFASKSNFKKAEFDGSQFTNCEFVMSQFGGSSMTSMTATGCSFDGSSFNRSHMSGCILQQCSFDACMFEGSDLSYSKLGSVTMSGVHFRGVSLAGAELDGVNFSGVSKRYVTEKLNIPNYAVSPPMNYLTYNNEEGSSSKARIDVLDDRANETLDVYFTAMSRSSKGLQEIVVAIPGATIFGPTNIDVKSTAYYLQSSLEVDIGCVIWNKLEAHDFAEIWGDWIRNFSSENWSSVVWSESIARLIMPDLEFSEAEAGGELNIDLGDAGKFIDLGSAENRAWVDPIFSGELQSLVNKRKGKEWKSTAALELSLRRAKSTRDDNISWRMAWSFDRVLDSSRLSKPRLSSDHQN